MIYSEAETIIAALSGVDQVQRVTHSWPVGRCDLPCIAVARAAHTPVDYRDGRAYLTALEYYVRVFASGAEQADAIAAQADAAMERLGYTCVFATDEDDKDTRIRAMRYQKIM